MAFSFLSEPSSPATVGDTLTWVVDGNSSDDYTTNQLAPFTGSGYVSHDANTLTAESFAGNDRDAFSVKLPTKGADVTLSHKIVLTPNEDENYFSFFGLCRFNVEDSVSGNWFLTGGINSISDVVNMRWLVNDGGTADSAPHTVQAGTEYEYIYSIKQNGEVTYTIKQGQTVLLTGTATGADVPTQDMYFLLRTGQCRAVVSDLLIEIDSITYQLFKDGTEYGSPLDTSDTTFSHVTTETGVYKLQATNDAVTIESSPVIVNSAAVGSLLPTFTDDNGEQFVLQAKSFSPKISINYKLIKMSERQYKTVDRGSSTDRYATELVISGTPDYIKSFVNAITLLRRNKKEVLIQSPHVNLFGDNVDHSVNISTVVGSFGKQKTVGRNVQEITITLIATDVTFVGSGSFPNSLQCLQNNWSGFAEWNSIVNETYNRDNYFVDREEDSNKFTGRYIMAIEENRSMLNHWRTTRGTPFSFTDSDFGATEMFGADAGTGSPHIGVYLDYKYSIMSPTHRMVTIELAKVNRL